MITEEGGALAFVAFAICAFAAYGIASRVRARREKRAAARARLHDPAELAAHLRAVEQASTATAGCTCDGGTRPTMAASRFVASLDPEDMKGDA